MRRNLYIGGMIIIGIGLSLGSVWGEAWVGKKDKEKIIIAGHSPKPHNRASAIGQRYLQLSKSKKPIRMPVYKPPKRGAPGGRVGGGTRGDYDANLTVYVLAPGKIRGLTSGDQPDLYWYVSKPTDVPIEFTLIDEAGVNPLVETKLPHITQAGIQRIQLSDFGIRLSPEKMYRWSVALVLEPDHRSKDVLASARIQQALPSEIPSNHVEQIDAIEATFTHAEAGLWYDAINVISKAIRESPDNMQFRQIRESLLEQVDLGKVADFDRQPVLHSRSF